MIISVSDVTLGEKNKTSVDGALQLSPLLQFLCPIDVIARFQTSPWCLVYLQKNEMKEKKNTDSEPSPHSKDIAVVFSQMMGRLFFSFPAFKKKIIKMSSAIQKCGKASDKEYWISPSKIRLYLNVQGFVHLSRVLRYHKLHPVCLYHQGYLKQKVTWEMAFLGCRADLTAQPSSSSLSSGLSLYIVFCVEF